ncbi:MAG: molybdenum cofactor biosynthesis protein MoeB, partial [Chloroflexi bacterium]|nr:molybdenum cofactor biosynthesis protein MoeB [Chloroflexota bacterium]
RLENAEVFPLGEFAARMNEFDSADEMVLFCRTGMRSAKALDLLRGAGFRKIKNLKGGINAWAREVDPEVPVY